MTSPQSNTETQKKHTHVPESSIDDWQKLKPFVNQHSQFEMPQMRWLLLHRKTNGLTHHVKKIGKAIYINTRTFPSWIESLSD